MPAADNESTIAIMRVVILMLVVAVAIIAVARRAYVPESVALVVAGLVASAIRPDLRLGITPGLVLAVLVPGLVFDAASRLRWHDLSRTLGVISLLALPGVLISAGVVALALTWTTGLPFELAFVVGAMAAATDPVAVVATFRRLQAPEQLATIVEGESLLNDGTGLVLFALAVRAVGSPIDLPSALLGFVATVAVSVVVGLLGGAAAAWLIRRSGDRAVEITVSIILAYGAYLIADAFGLSGIIATVIAGIVLRFRLEEVGDQRDTIESLDTIWAYVAFALTALVFLIVGLSIKLDALWAAAAPILWAAAALLLARAFIVYALVGGLARVRHALGAEALPISWLHVVFWAGLRGAIATAAALSLPADFPQRSLLQGITFGIVLVTLLVQGVTAGPLVRRALHAGRELGVLVVNSGAQLEIPDR